MVGVEIKFESKNYYNKEGTKRQKKSVLTHMFVYLYCLKSSLVNPLSWIIFICFTIVLFPDSPAPKYIYIDRDIDWLID